MKEGEILDYKEIELGGKKFVAFLRVCLTGKRIFNKRVLFICPKISPAYKFYNRGKQKNILSDYPKLRENAGKAK